MTATLVEDLDFDAQMAIWDAAYSGDVAEWTACMSEHPERTASFAGMAWFDGTAHDLASIQLWSGTERRDPPLWWALPGVVESQLWTP